MKKRKETCVKIVVQHFVVVREGAEKLGSSVCATCGNAT